MGFLINYVAPTLHVLACLFLIVVVLLQTGKGADMGAVFGGGSQTLFGSSGAGNFLTKLTTGTAILFMVTSLILTYGSTRLPSSRLLEHLPAPAAESETVPAPQAQAPAAQPEQPPATPPAEQAPAPENAPAPGE